MRRFFAARIEDGIAYFDAQESAHMRKVLRMTEGMQIIVPEGRGEWLAEITEMGAEAQAKLLEWQGCKAEPNKKITLYLAYTKSDKMELVVQKAVELGASAVQPFISSRCVKIPDAKSAQKGNERMSRIAHEAVKQCGRAADMTVGMPLKYNEFLQAIGKHDLTIFAYECADEPLKPILSTDAEDIAIIIGCEGGFSEKEAEEIIAAGAKCISLGARILRAETAAIALLAITAYETGC